MVVTPKSDAPRSLESSALVALEWTLVCEALVARTRSPLGAEAAAQHAPLSTPAASRRLRQRVLEALILTDRSSIHGEAADARDVSDPLDRAALGGTLDPTLLYQCGRFFTTVGILGEELRARRAEAPFWAGDFDPAPRVPAACERITRSVTGEGVILDSASPELARLRQLRVQKRQELERTLSTRVKEWSAQGLLQDDFYDQVDGRYVVPVKVSEQSRLTGTLVGRSNTGQSLFVEPAELTASNNALKEVDLAIRAEELRILRALSAEVGGLTPVFLPWIAVVAELDLAFAAARLAKDWDLNAPESESESESDSDSGSGSGSVSGSLDLRDVFHPALKLRAVEIVCNSVALSSGGSALLISGPNTGGKTVLLKAVALTACLARAGLLIPAQKGSRVPHYAAVFAFIGDEQNLAAGLSSFSAQIADLRQVLDDSRGPLLVVIDEILSSTDPEEAAALAQAVIEELVARGHHVIVTSHFSELSLRARSIPNVAVGAMEFDEGRPTYRLRAGELGSSHALEVAERLGFSARLLARARGLMSTAKLDYERAVEELKSKQEALEREHATATAAFERESARREAESLNRERELRTQVESFLAQAQSQLTGAVAALQEKATTGARAVARAAAIAREAVTTMQKSVAPTLERLSATAAAPTAAPLPIVEGVQVKIKSMAGARGTVLQLKGVEGARVAVVQAGNFRLEKPLSDLEAIPRPREKLARHSSYVGLDSGAESVPRKLDVRGKRYDEALAECERYVDRAFRGGAAQVTIVTGHGTGALKKGLKELLGGLPYVREFRPEREGDDGATLIEFDR